MSDADTRSRMVVASYLLPEPAGEIIRDLIGQLDDMADELAALREYIRWHRTNTTGTPTYSGAAQAAALRAMEEGR